ncbi:uncharacterized protein ColSpa_10695 [Colletotrichum spaethianum]|uniref:Uncharacterized protein n=1 Tax=Colletotrichum spaethianum TaxID=700344 RepID=A0AA37PE37_9PEZI|nr:uncharacterized protein ColSpa_10695 [Colletotrichum spaethianum]GKT50514.1 hypothetical protein ColSpa_10695 [Colletotrichum spaethianum]
MPRPAVRRTSRYAFAWTWEPWREQREWVHRANSRIYRLISYPANSLNTSQNTAKVLAGFAVGVIGLPGLFSSCLQAVNKVESYRSVRIDKNVQYTLFDATKTRFEQ